MTQEEFIKVLNRKKYPYRIKGDKIIVMASFFSADLSALTSLPPGVVFNNVGGVYLEFLIGVWLYEWEGNIKGIRFNRLLNKMIPIGLFNR